MVGPDHRDPPARARRRRTPFLGGRVARLHRRRAARALVEPVPRSAARLGWSRRRCARTPICASPPPICAAPAPCCARPARGRLPTTEISASATYGQEPGGDADGDLYDAGIDVGYQLDLFGRITRAIQASRADAEAVQAAFDLTRITVAAETTRAYADACSAGRQLAVAREKRAHPGADLRSHPPAVRGRPRHRARDQPGRGAARPDPRRDPDAWRRSGGPRLYRLSVLTGRPPADFPPEAAACEAPPALARPIPVGDGAALLARRPDIRAAERTLAAATARVGVATADLYPSISLGGSVGSTAGSPGGLRVGRRLPLQPRAAHLLDLPQHRRRARPHRPGRGLGRGRAGRASTAPGCARSRRPKARSPAMPASSTGWRRSAAPAPRAPRRRGSPGCATRPAASPSRSCSTPSGPCPDRRRGGAIGGAALRPALSLCSWRSAAAGRAKRPAASNIVADIDDLGPSILNMIHYGGYRGCPTGASEC